MRCTTINRSRGSPDEPTNSTTAVSADDELVEDATDTKPAKVGAKHFHIGTAAVDAARRTSRDQQGRGGLISNSNEFRMLCAQTPPPIRRRSGKPPGKGERTELGTEARADVMNKGGAADIVDRLVNWKRREARKVARQEAAEALLAEKDTEPTAIPLARKAGYLRTRGKLGVDGAFTHPSASQKAQNRALCRGGPFEDLGDESDDSKPDLCSSIARKPRGGIVSLPRGDAEDSDDEDLTYCRNIPNTRLLRNHAGMRSDILQPHAASSFADRCENGSHSKAISLYPLRLGRGEHLSHSDHVDMSGREEDVRHVADGHCSPSITGSSVTTVEIPCRRIQEDWSFATSGKSGERASFDTKPVRELYDRGPVRPTRQLYDPKAPKVSQPKFRSMLTAENGMRSELAGVQEDYFRYASGTPSSRTRTLYDPNHPVTNCRSTESIRVDLSCQMGTQRPFSDDIQDKASLLRELENLERVVFEVQDTTQDMPRLPVTNVGGRFTVGTAANGASQRDVGWWREKIQSSERLANTYLRLAEICPSACGGALELNDLSMDLESRCWKFAFYILIEEFRRSVRLQRPAIQKTQDTLDSREDVGELFVEFLDFAGQFYKELGAALAAAGAALAKSRSSLASSYTLRLPRWHRCVVAQGDISRYMAMHRERGRIDALAWESARRWYLFGLRLCPSNGKLYNQLGIMVGSKSVEKLYYLCRSQFVRQPFSSAREAIQSLLEANRQRMLKAPPAFLTASLLDAHCNAQATSPYFEAVDWNAYVDVFVRFHGMMYTKISLDAIDATLSPFLRAWPASSGVLPLAFVFLYFQAAVINLCALNGYGKIPRELSGIWQAGIFGASAQSSDGGFGSEELLSPALNVTDQEEEDFDPVAFDAAPKLAFGMMTAAMKRYLAVHSGDGGPISEGLLVYVEVILTWLVGSGVLHSCAGGSTWDKRYAYKELVGSSFWFDLADFLTCIALQVSVQARAEIASAVKSAIHPAAKSTSEGGSAYRPSLKLMSPPNPEDWTLRGLVFLAPTHGARETGFGEFAAYLKAFENSRFPDEPPVLTGIDGSLWTSEAEENAHVSRRRRVIELGSWLCRLVEALRFDEESGEFSADTSLEITRTRGWQNVLGTRALSPEEDPESISTEIAVEEDTQEVDYGNSSEDEDIRALKARRKQLKELLYASRAWSNPAPDSEARPPELVSGVFAEGRSVLVIDTNCFVGDLFLVKRIFSMGRIPIVVPLVVITELDGLQKKTTPLGAAAAEALKFLEDFIKNGPKLLAKQSTRPLRIVTSKGNAVPGLGFRENFVLTKSDGEHEDDDGEDDVGQGDRDSPTTGVNRNGATVTPYLRRYKAGPQKASQKKARNLDDLILETCVALQGSTGEAASSTTAYPRGVVAILITDDANLRIKARVRDVATADGRSVIRQAKNRGWL